MEYKYMQLNLFPSVHMDEDYHEERQVMDLGSVERVGGKLRSIIHIKKWEYKGRWCYVIAGVYLLISYILNMVVLQHHSDLSLSNLILSFP